MMNLALLDSDGASYSLTGYHKLGVTWRRFRHPGEGNGNIRFPRLRLSLFPRS
jgi:hypothetical protein